MNAVGQKGGSRERLQAVWESMRPAQWTKNAVVLAAFFFALGDRSRPHPLGWQHLLGQALPAVVVFCILSGAVYLLNDANDVEADRQHPVKRLRPVASGALSPTEARLLGVGVGAAALLGAAALGRGFFLVILVYSLIQALYTAFLKHHSLLDIFVIASGFVLRAVAGAVVLPHVTISPWLLICAFLLALFIALCKRRHEKLLSEKIGSGHRPMIEQYPMALLDQLIAVTASATIVCYSIYTLWPQTVQKFGGHGLGVTIPLVVYAIFRYLTLAYRHQEGERPERILFTDRPLLLDLMLYGLTVIGVIFLTPK